MDGEKKGESKFKIKELGSKYLFTLIYCFIEKNLIKYKKMKFFTNLPLQKAVIIFFIIILIILLGLSVIL